MLTSCFDNNYDLSDIDKTVRVDVNDLTIPVNIEPVTLGALIDIKPDDKLQLVDGKYCIVQDGDFHSSEVKIDPVHASAPAISPTTTEIRLSSAMPHALADMPEIPDRVTYDLHSEPTRFEYTGNGNKFVKSIETIYGETTFSVDVVIEGLGNDVHAIELHNLVLQMPAGLKLTTDKGGTYDANTGLLTYDQIRTNGHHETLNMHVSEIDFAKMGGEYADQKVSINGELSVVSGQLVLLASDIDIDNSALAFANLPEVLTMKNSYAMSDIDIDLFTGKICYDVEDLDINDIDLTDLPEAVTGEGTRISLANPQIYLSVNNPLHQYGLTATSGMSFTSYPRFSSGTTATGSLPAGAIEIAGTMEQIEFCLSPKQPEKYYDGFGSAKFVEFADLANVLDCGTSVPERIGVELVDPIVPEQRVERFELGVNLGKINGDYTFVAPLQFNNNSTVSYTDRLDGWSSEDLEYLTVEKLEVNFTVDSDLPLQAEVYGYPLDKNGNQINNVVIEPATVGALAAGQEVSLRASGEFSGLDGIYFEVKVVAKGDNTPALTPDMGLTLHKVRPVVSGYYQKEL